MTYLKPQTKHVATVSGVVRGILSATTPPGDYQLISNKNIGAFPAEFWREYRTNHRYIDRMLMQHYGNYVVPQCSEPSEITGQSINVLLRSQLSENVNPGFLAQNITALKQLWKLESVEFNPVYNYDRNSTITTVRSGSESNEMTYRGGQTNTHAEREYTDMTIDRIGARDTTETDTHGTIISSTSTAYGAQEEKTVGDSQTTRINNQTQTTKHHDTSYDTNLVSSDEIEYSGNGDTDTSNNTTTITTKAHEDTTSNSQDEYEDKIKTSTSSTSDEHTYNAGDRKVTDTSIYEDRSDHNDKTYNDVTDTTTEKVEGNIGVTTATAMMREYKEFYVNYSFWTQFWKLWVAYACSSTYARDTAEYEDWYI